MTRLRRRKLRIVGKQLEKLASAVRAETASLVEFQKEEERTADWTPTKPSSQRAQEEWLGALEDAVLGLKKASDALDRARRCLDG